MWWGGCSPKYRSTNCSETANRRKMSKWWVCQGLRPVRPVIAETGSSFTGGHKRSSKFHGEGPVVQLELNTQKNFPQHCGHWVITVGYGHQHYQQIHFYQSHLGDNAVCFLWCCDTAIKTNVMYLKCSTKRGWLNHQSVNALEGERDVTAIDWEQTSQLTSVTERLAPRIEPAAQRKTKQNLNYSHIPKMTELHPDKTGWTEAQMKEQKEN